MPANNRPRYPATANVVVVKGMSAGNNTSDLSAATLNTDVWLLHTAGANGAFHRGIVLKVQPANAVVATVARVWVSTAGTLPGAALYKEIELQAFTPTATTASPEIVVPINTEWPAATTVYITFGTDPGTGSYAAVSDGADY